MEWAILLVIGLAFVASMLTLFSGFGLGTLLLPAFALVFEIEVAVAATAVVHLANNLWKAVLLRRPSWPIVLRFGLPAMLLSFVGAWALLRLPAREIESIGTTTTVTAIVVGSLVFVFGLIDLLSWSPRIPARWLPLGGAASGFFGGLSGHQGALRSMVLTKTGLDAPTFVATGVFCAILVDVVRLAVYGAGALRIGDEAPLVIAATITAFVGALVGKRLLGKVTIDQVRRLVGSLLLLAGAAMALGLT